MDPDFNVLGQELLFGVIRLLFNPLYPLSMALIFLIYWRKMRLERTHFSVRFQTPWKETGKAVLWGWAIGVTISFVMLIWGMSMTFESLLIIWAATLLFWLFRVRFLCLAYAVGAVGLLQTAWLMLPERLDWAWRSVPMVNQIGEALLVISLPALLVTIGLLHLAEAVMIQYQGGKADRPILLHSKRGKVIGGHLIEGFWPVPLLLLVPVGTLEGSFWWPDHWNAAIHSLPWTPLLQADWSQGWKIMAIPVVIGFSEWTRTFWPEEKAKQMAKRIYLYGIIMIGLAFIVYAWEAWAAIASLLAIGLHEVIRYIGKKEEQRHPPKYVHDRRGMKILAVLPNSPAEAAGLMAGEVVVRVNDVNVTDRESLHQALRVNSAYCKLEVLNRAGEKKFVNRAMFSGEHHQLGMIMVPDEQTAAYLKKDIDESIS